MSDPRFPQFTISDRLREWVARRPGPAPRPPAGPPCAGCGPDPKAPAPAAEPEEDE